MTPPGFGGQWAWSPDLPPRAAGSCSSEGCGWLLGSVYMDTTIPGLQILHRVPWLSAVLSWKDTGMVTGPAFLLPPPPARVHILCLSCHGGTLSLSSAPSPWAEWAVIPFPSGGGDLEAVF